MTFWPLARVGDRSEQIRRMQVRIGCVNATGLFDETTEIRLRGWQATHRLPPTGVVDEETAEELGWE